MYQGKTVFSQLIDFLPMHRFRQCVSRYHGNKGIRKFSCLDQFLCMAFAQLTFRESLRDIECCLRAMREKLYHADANEKRDWRIYRDFAHVLIGQARTLYADEDFGVQLDETVYALDATIIDLCLSLFPWANFRKTKGAVKLHTLLDLRGNIPSFIAITDGKIHEVNILDVLLPEIGAIYIMDRGYLDFERLFALHQARAFFIIRAKSNTDTRRLYSMAVDKSTGLRCDQVVTFNGFYSKNEYPEKLRRVVFFDNQQRRRLVFLTNHLSLPALTIADLYRCRWQVELFFKWIKQHLRIKSFYGTTENAVKTQIWIAITVYVLVAIVRKRLKIELSLYTMLQILSLTLFEKNHVSRVFTEIDYKNQITSGHRQLNLF